MYKSLNNINLQTITTTTVSTVSGFISFLYTLVYKNQYLQCQVYHGTHVRHENISAVFLAPPVLFTLSHKQHDFWKKVTGHETFVLILSTTVISNISHSKKKSARYCHKRKKRLFLSDFNET